MSEAPLRMQINKLDPEVAEIPESAAQHTGRLVLRPLP